MTQGMSRRQFLAGVTAVGIGAGLVGGEGAGHEVPVADGPWLELTSGSRVVSEQDGYPGVSGLIPDGWHVYSDRFLNLVTPAELLTVSSIELPAAVDRSKPDLSRAPGDTTVLCVLAYPMEPTLGPGAPLRRYDDSEVVATLSLTNERLLERTQILTGYTVGPGDEEVSFSRWESGPGFDTYWGWFPGTGFGMLVMGWTGPDATHNATELALAVRFDARALGA